MSKPSSLRWLTFAGPPAMPTLVAPTMFAICPTTEPTGPDAAATATVSPGLGMPISSSPAYAVNPGMPRTPSAVDTGAISGRCGAAGTRTRSSTPASAVAEHDVTGVEVRRIRFDHLGHGRPDHDLADLDGLRIGFRVRHASAHVGVEGEIEGAQQNLAFAGASSGTSSKRKFSAVGAPTGREFKRMRWFVVMTAVSFQRLSGLV